MYLPAAGWPKTASANSISSLRSVANAATLSIWQSSNITRLKGWQAGNINQPASPSTFLSFIPYHHISDISKQVDKFARGGHR